MEKWYSIVRNMKDDSDNGFLIQTITHRIFHDATDLLPLLKKRQRSEKNKDIVSKFKQRLGPEFTEWEARLEQEFSSDIVKDIVTDDEFWGATMDIVGFP